MLKDIAAMPEEAGYVPTWSGDPSAFESFVVSCKWYERSLKDTERKQAAARVWSRLQGAAKAVVKHLDPDEYSGEDGLTKLLQVLRTSPLQALPVPDSFSRLERWHSLRRKENESIAELLVREEDMWLQMQSALVRARADRGKGPRSSATPEIPRVVDPSPTGASSPNNVRRNWHSGASTTSQTTGEGIGVPLVQTTTTAGLDTTDFWSNELRGYRLLKASHLTRQERQNILTQTNNATDFEIVKRALRAMFAEDEAMSRPVNKRFARNTFWNDTGDWEEYEYDAEDYDESWHQEPNDAFWQDGDSWSWQDDYAYEGEEEYEENAEPDETAEDPDEVQYREAYALANEASRTLQEAREAVKKVRAARGYFSPESNSGKGISKGSASRMLGKGKGSGGRHNGKGNYGSDSCFRCGMPGHTSAQCPDRFSPGKGVGKGFKGRGKGKGKSKSKSKLKGKTFYSDICTLTVMWNKDAEARQTYTRVVIDTGASESAVGSSSLSKLLDYGRFEYSVHVDDRPIFRFGNGMKMQAMSRVDIEGTSLGRISFYVLGGTAEDTPPLLGSKVLYQRRAHISYANSTLIFEARPWEDSAGGVFAVPIEILPTWHMTLDLREHALMMDGGNFMVQSLPTFAPTTPDQYEVVDSDEQGEVFLPLFVLSRTCKSSSLSDRLQLLAQRLQDLRGEPTNDGTMCPRRSSSRGISMLDQPQWQDKEQPVCELGDMHKMRAETVLQTKEGICRRDTPHGACAPHHQVCDGGDGEGYPTNGMQREDCQGKMLQCGMTNTMAINMTYQEYRKRMNMDIPKTKGQPKMSPKLTPDVKKAAAEELIQTLKNSASSSASSEAMKLIQEAAQTMEATKKSESTKTQVKSEKKDEKEEEVDSPMHGFDVVSVASSKEDH